MNHLSLEKKFACPRCNNNLNLKLSGICKKCKFKFKKKDGIWHFLLIDKNTKASQVGYELLHRARSGGPKDGSYEILASFARGNNTVDIACGEGIIEKLAPNTVGVDFSLNALKKAKVAGAKFLVLADAQALPFNNNSFDLAICAGSLEHFPNPQKAILEMARISKIQIFTFHSYPTIPFAPIIHKLFSWMFKITNQPIEQPVTPKKIEEMLKKSELYVVFKGIWTLPLNYGRPIRFLPEFKNITSCSFIVSAKKI